MICILLIGIQEDYAIRKGFRCVTNLFRSCATLEEAQVLIKETDLFLLDSGFGLNDCSCFLEWAAKNTQAIGVIVEDVLNNWLCIEALNSGIVCDYLIRPITPERYAEACDRFREKLLSKKL